MNKRRHSLFCLTVLVAFSAHSASAVDLTPVNDINVVGANPVGMASGDFDHDGFVDLVTANWNGANVSVLLNKGNGNGKFKNADPYGVGVNPHAVAVGDFNGDTFLDLAVANVGGGVSILLNKPGNPGHFKAKTDIPAGDFPYAIAVGDFNGDNILDLAVVNQGKGVSILLGNGVAGVGDGTFGAPTLNPVPAVANPVSVVFGAFNTGVKRDLAVVDSGGKVYILIGNGNGTFQAPSPIATLPRPFAIVTDDLDLDSKADLVVTDYSNQVFVLKGLGGGAFQAPVPYATGWVPTSVAVGDFNFDGKKDLVVANSYSGTVSIWHGTGTGTFINREDTTTGILSAYVVAADFLNAPPTAQTDVAVALYMFNQVSILKGVHPPAPPPTPTLVGHTMGFAGCANVPTCSVNYTATAGNTLVVACVGYFAVTATVTDGVNPMTKDGQQADSGTGTTSFTSLFHSFGVAGGNHTITCTTTGNSYGIVIVAEFSGVTATDGAFTSAMGNSTSADSGALSTGHAIDLLVGTVSTNSAANPCTFTPTGGWTLVNSSLDGSHVGCAGMVYQVVSATGSYNTTVTVSPEKWAAAIRAFK